MSMSPSQLGAFARSGPDVASADLEYHVQPLSLDAFGEPLHPFDAITASVCNLRPESRGSVRIAASDPAVPPEIRTSLRESGVIVEAVSTGSAIRTYNVLLAENRAVGAALISVEKAR